MPRDPRMTAPRSQNHEDLDEQTMVDGRRIASPPPSPPPARPALAAVPQSAPRMAKFVPAESVMATVSYRGSSSPAPSTPAARPTHAGFARGEPSSDMGPSGPGAQQELSQALAQLEASVMERVPTPPRVAHASPLPGPLPTMARRGELIVVFGCRGGSGATTLAINTAAQLCRGGRTACIVDLDLQLGDVFVALDLEPQTSLASVAREAGALDATSLRRRLAQHGSGLCALTQAGHVDDLDDALPGRIPALLDTLRAHFDYVVVDGVRDFGDAALPALEAATQIHLVITQDVPSVRRAARALTLMRRLGIPDGKLRLILNRAVRGAAIDDAAIRRALGLDLAARVRDDAKVADALDAGALLLDIARSRGISDDLAAVASLVRGSTEPAARRGLFGLFGAKGAK